MKVGIESLNRRAGVGTEFAQIVMVNFWSTGGSELVESQLLRSKENERVERLTSLMSLAPLSKVSSVRELIDNTI